MTFRAFAFSAALAATAFVSHAHATTIAALGVDGKSVILIDFQKAKVVETIKLSVGQKLLAFDHPGAGKLIYAIDGKARLSTIDPKSWKVKAGAKLPVTIDSKLISLDCTGKPAVCTLASDKALNAFFSTRNTEGEIGTYSRFVYQGGSVPARVVGVAMSAAGGTYMVEAMNDSLCKQQTFTEISAQGPLGIFVEGPLGFDILNTKTTNAGYMIYEKSLYPVDLVSGAVGAPKKIKGLKVDIRDMTFLPD